MDVMAVQPVPLLKASSAYFKLKLTVHNFTIYNMETRDSLSYWFDESEGNLVASTFASCLINYLIELHQVHSRPIVIYSDGCAAQNRNATLSNALLHLSYNLKVPITQKFLERGHTQMECDSVHSMIERQFKNVDVPIPSQFLLHTAQARSTPTPYRAVMLDHTFFQNFDTNVKYTSIRPGRKSGDPTVNELRVIHYDPSGVIMFKLNFDDDLKELPFRSARGWNGFQSIESFPRLHKSRLPITLDKWTDLQALKQYIPRDCHYFYDNIPCSTTSKRANRKKNEDD